ncbi:MAG: malectin domain-containing carbohydrate-binding protein [Prochlorococcaceae cyanobacterium]
MAITFSQVGSFQGVQGGAVVLTNPTSLAFGPDGRLYVSEQDGTINAFAVDLQNGQFVATSHEELTLAGGGGVVKSIINHNDDGAKNLAITNRQVTGMLVTGTATNPVVYISSSDPRIAVNNDSNLDTNSGVVSRAIWTGSTWEVVDLVRGLPRSEENHSVNGMVLSPDGSKLYLSVGGNTNNGAPSQFFANTGEYVLSGTVLEIDLVDLDSRPLLTDPAAGLVDGSAVARNYIYDLPTLDDPSVPNDGIQETPDGLDVAGPWGGNDGLNMAILPADAPLRVYADGFRNAYDLVVTSNGNLYTLDNGSNNNLGGDPVFVDGEPTNQINNGGSGAPEPLFLIQEGGYYGHPAPVRSNQSLEWTAWDDSGNPDAALSVNTVADLSGRVPTSLGIPSGFLIDPSRFSGDPGRLAQSGIRVPFNSPDSPSIVNIGSSSNGLAEYTNGSVFGGALDGALMVAQFNGNITLLNVNEAGTALDPLVSPGPDGILNTADDVVLASTGVYSLITGLSTPLDVIEGPNGTIWVAEIGGDAIKVFAPAEGPAAVNPDFDNDGIPNALDPFTRDRENGTGTTLLPGQSLLWDFDPNQDGNRPGPNGYGGGVTGVMVNGATDYEVFFQEPSPRNNQVVNLDNVKFTTAAGGGTIVVEEASNGDPLGNQNDGTFLFHTGLAVSPSTDLLSIRWSVANPGTDLSGGNQQIGGYVGTGDQSSYLKIVATQDPGGQIQLLLEDNDVVLASSFLQAPDLFNVPADQTTIDFELAVNVGLATATGTISYQTATGEQQSITSPTLSLADTQLLESIRGNGQVLGKPTALAAGLFASNTGQPETESFQAVFRELEISGASSTAEEVLYRVNAGGPAIAATDAGPSWEADTAATPSVYLASTGSNSTASFPAVAPSFTLPASVPGALFDSERFDLPGGTAMGYAFPVATGLYDVRLYMGNGFSGTSDIGERIFDVALEGGVPTWLSDIDLSSKFGHLVGGVLSTPVFVDDGALNIDFLHGVQNPLLNGIEILRLNDQPAAIGEAVLTITQGINDVQVSNFLANSFQITNTGDLTISRVTLDVTDAVYSDLVYDPFGLAGDSVAKPLSIDLDGNTGIVAPSSSSYIGAGGPAGYKSIELLFNPEVNNGFNSGETLGFSIDMDSNSIRGTQKAPLDAGSSPSWDVGGVSGSELIGSRFTVEFSDGSSATGQLMGDGSQAGSQALASLRPAAGEVALQVNGTNPGGVGSYGPSGAQVIVQGPAGSTARVVLSKGFIQPLTPYADFLADQLAELAQGPFPANNAVEVQTVDVLLTGEEQDISDQFNLAGVATVNFPGEDQLPLRFVASLIDPANQSLPIGPVTDPVTVRYQDSNPVLRSLYRVNAGGPAIAASDGGPDWLADTTAAPAPFLIDAGSNSSAGFAAVEPGASVHEGTPEAIFKSERWDAAGGTPLRYAFPVIDGSYEVRLYMANGWVGTSGAGQRVFDVAIEGSVPAELDDIDLVSRFGHQVGGVLSSTVEVSDGELNIDFLHQVQNPLVNGIEIRQVESSSSPGVVQIGTDDDDRLVGGAGDDWLVGLSGNDVLNGGGGDDIMIGGTGNDSYVVNSPDDKVIELPEEGIDLVRSSIAYTLPANVDRLTLTGTAAIAGTGNELSNRIAGNNADNILDGLDGDDVLIGRGGNNILIGGAGRDILIGGPGANTFRYGSLTDSLRPGASRDRIRDLKIGTDFIDGPTAVAAADVVQAGEAAGLNASAVAAVLSADTFSANGAATFTLGSRTFLGLNDSRAGFQSATDSIIDITGYSGNLDNLAIV